ncbi:Intraflagellar transport protein 46 [Dirofilaria immitis]|nr:Intraflagellar transport protein 46 [Dirofilaria immitis]
MEHLTNSSTVHSEDTNNSKKELSFSSDNKSLPSDLSSDKLHGKSTISAMVQGITELATATAIGTGNVTDNDKTATEKFGDKSTNLFTLLGSEEKELLSYIESYTAKTIHIETFLKPFLPDYIPAVGDVDVFIKIPRPDEVEDDLGLVILDEPGIEQSDPIILNMKMRNELKDSKNVLVKDVPVKKLERADENIEEIEHWISSIKEWPSDVENLLKIEQLPSASLDVSLEEYVDICLALFDIPVQKSRIQSLHVLFTLFAEFRNSQHFRNLAKNNFMNSSNINNNGFNGRNNINEPERLEL